jgi:DNA-binding transcriptional LysR family regulator
MMSGIYPEMHIKLELEQTEAIKRAVMAGMGISCLSKLSVEKELKTGELVQLQTKERDMSRQLYLVKHKDKYTGAGLKRFVAHCLALAG